MHSSLIFALEGHAQRQPKAPALLWRGREISYGQLLDSARQACAQVTALGAAARSPVGLPATKSPWTIAVALGCLMSGRAVLFAAVDLPSATARAVYEQAGCGLVLATQPGVATDVVTHLVEHDPGVPRTTRTCPPPRPDDVAFLLTTSGSTGVPKVVPISVGAIDRFVDWADGYFEFGSGQVVLSYAPLNFDLSLLDVWTTLALGGCVVLVDPERSTDGRYLGDLIAAHRVSLMQAVPMMYQLVVDATADTGRQLPEVRHAAFSGDHLPAGCLVELSRLLPNARLHNIYGCTETNDSFVYEVSDPATTPVPMPLGEPLPGVEFHLVGPDGRVLVGAGVGELNVHTPFLTSGYVDDARNAERFVPHPAGADDRTYFRSGDLVRRHEDGTCTLEGRVDHQIKVRGVQVNTQQVEQVLLAHEEVYEAAVLVEVDPVGGRRLHAVVRLPDGCRVNSLDLRRHCIAHLPRAAVPTTLEIVTESLPRTSSGKVDRTRLAERARPTDALAVEQGELAMLRRFIIEEFAPDLTADQLTADHDLISDGLLDSIGMLKVVAWLGRTFGVDIEQFDFTPERFRSLNAILSMTPAVGESGRPS
ncbi:AMP-binding protein [Micromonospora sp. CPCC 206060]|uniref:non-ribosomal peptide synthetase n=1 Tax=Micromonospora sp. CPCC 206060 TaxID=3122406 RepID=UPI002FF064E3